MSTTTIKPGIRKAGQRYVDQAVYLKPKRLEEIHLSVALALNPHARPTESPELLSHYERTHLRWMKPGEHGLRPAKPRDTP